MKVAVLITGQLRTVDMVKYSHLHTIIEKYDTDVFLSINTDNNLQTLNKNCTQSSKHKINEIINFFKPVSYFVSDSYVCDFPFKLLFEQYFIVDKGYQLIKDTNNQYDLIIRLRFDQFLWPEDFDVYFKLDIKDNVIVYNEKNITLFKEFSNYKVKLYQPLDNEIYVPGQGQYTHFHYVNNQFFYHNMSLLDTMLCFYKEIPILLELAVQEGNTGGCIFEHVFSIFFKRKQINIKSANLHSQIIYEYLE